MPPIARSVIACVIAATGTAARAAPPPIAPAVQPPARVGRLAAVSGAVSFHTRDQTAWTAALSNTPVTSGDAVWTEPGARAAVDVAGNRIWLDSRTLLEVPALDDHAVNATETQGTLYLHLRTVAPGEAYTVQTPRGTVQLLASGRYEVVAGDASEPTRVTVLDGAAQVTAPGLTLDVGPNVTATLTGAGTEADPVHGVLGPAQRDAFLTATLALERPAVAHPTIGRMTGAEDLDQYGTWQDRPRYGAVWYPPVEPGWVPYRHGRWSWVAPWGWTWVDEAPWGFAPFHYGRWIQEDGRWGWTPAPAPEYVAQPATYIEPVYAPALVSFVALAAVGVAYVDRPVGWFPLGPNEPYYPPYRAPLAYVQRINFGTVQNARTVINDNSVHTNIYNRVTVQNFINRGAVTVTPASAVVGSRPIAAAVLPPAVVAPAVARAQTGFQPGFVPTAATLGVTPTVARQFNFAAAPVPASPGPAIVPRGGAVPGQGTPGQGAPGQGTPGQGTPGGMRAGASVPGDVRPSGPVPALPGTSQAAPNPAATPGAPAAAPGLSGQTLPAGRPAAPAAGLPGAATPALAPPLRGPQGQPAAGTTSPGGSPIATPGGVAAGTVPPTRPGTAGGLPPIRPDARADRAAPATPVPGPGSAAVPGTGANLTQTPAAPSPQPARPASPAVRRADPVPPAPRARPVQPRPEAPRPQPQRIDPARVPPPRPEPPRVAPPRPEPARAAPPRMAPPRPEPPRPEPPRAPPPPRPAPPRVQPPRPAPPQPRPAPPPPAQKRPERPG